MSIHHSQLSIHRRATPRGWLLKAACLAACGGVRDRLAGEGGSSQTVLATGGPGPEQQQGGAVVLSHTEGRAAQNLL